MKSILISFIVLLSSISFAQNTQKADETMLDFWVGKWKLTWTEQNGTIGKGTNEIKKILNDKVVQEKFEAKSGELKDFKGRSLSLIDAATGKWKQIWVDNQNSYLEFEGFKEGEKVIFQREFKNKEGKIVLQRMVFKDISNEKFTWDWESSSDEGKSWELKWQINYERKIKKEKKTKLNE